MRASESVLARAARKAGRPAMSGDCGVCGGDGVPALIFEGGEWMPLSSANRFHDRRALRRSRVCRGCHQETVGLDRYRHTETLERIGPNERPNMPDIMTDEHEDDDHGREGQGRDIYDDDFDTATLEDADVDVDALVEELEEMNSSGPDNTACEENHGRTEEDTIGEPDRELVVPMSAVEERVANTYGNGQWLIDDLQSEAFVPPVHHGVPEDAVEEYIESRLDNVSRVLSGVFGDEHRLTGAADASPDARKAIARTGQLADRVESIEDTLSEAARDHETSDGRPPVALPGRLDEIERAASEARADTKDESTVVTLVHRVDALEDKLDDALDAIEYMVRARETAEQIERRPNAKVEGLGEGQ